MTPKFLVFILILAYTRGNREQLSKTDERTSRITKTT